MKNRLLSFMLLVLLVPLATGCIYSRELSNSKREIERGYPDLDIDKRLTLSFGPRSLHTVGWIARRIPEEETQQAASYLRTLERVKVALYDVDYLDENSRANRAAVTDFEKNGWTLAVRAQEDSEAVWVLYRSDYKDDVRDIKVVVLGEDELVIARVQGHLNELLEDLMDDHNLMDDIF